MTIGIQPMRFYAGSGRGGCEFQVSLNARLGCARILSAGISVAGVEMGEKGSRRGRHPTHDGEAVMDGAPGGGLVGASRKAGWSFRLRLHSGLRQHGAHPSRMKPRDEWGTRHTAGDRYPTHDGGAVMDGAPGSPGCSCTTSPTRSF